MYPMDPRLLKQMHEQMVRDAQRKALPRELRAARKRRTSWALALDRISIRVSRLRPRPEQQSTRRGAMNYRGSRWLRSD
jgi:hypothetical protein